MDEPGRTSVWSDLADRALPLIRGVVRSSGLDMADSEAVSRRVLARLRPELTTIDDDEALYKRVFSAVAWTLRDLRHEPGAIGAADYRQFDSPKEIAARYSEVDHRLSRLTTTERKLLRLLLLEDMSYRDISESLEMPVGSIGPTRERLFRRMRRFLRSDAPPRGSEPRGDRSAAREDLDAALQTYVRRRTGLAQQPEDTWVRKVARTFGLVPPPWSPPAAPADLVVAACRDVTGAMRETLREVTAVAAERNALSAGDR